MADVDKIDMLLVHFTRTYGSLIYENSTSLLVGCLVAWLVVWLVGWLVVWLVV